jgi:hypothetical protein
MRFSPCRFAGDARHGRCRIQDVSEWSVPGVEVMIVIGNTVGPLLILAVFASAATLTASQTRESDRVDERTSKVKVGAR